ncbi:jg11092 [Pararge aegeria aegeria]|uniref:Jg11092 protein n=1 Tax=Pararge aegeria aegeria TaxID=348720 RepID=A0A8S4QD76_9NEOP|nr:jg11092 [Pararge aegeria aegeria]
MSFCDYHSDISAEAILVDIKIYLSIANKCLELSCFPVSWKQAAVIVLRKPGKADYSQAKSYRPIGLLPILGKILEKMIVRRIRWHLLPKANPRQYGFVPQRSTEDSLYDLVQQIRSNIDKRLLNVHVSLDIEGAFDGACYLKDRQVGVRYAEKEHVVSTSKGCIQGSIAGPTFWNLLLEPLLEEIDGRKVHCQAFADDIVLVISGGSVADIEEKANQVLNRVFTPGKGNNRNLHQPRRPKHVPTSTRPKSNSIKGLSIFTDGSKIDGKVGAALSCWEGEKEIRSSKFLLEPYCTVFQAELLAICKATDIALKSSKPFINILSDSRSALECIGNPGTFHPLAFEARKNLTLIREGGSTVTRLFWIRAYVGVVGNERADVLAKEAARKKKTAPDYDKCPLSFLKRTIRQKRSGIGIPMQ